MAVERVALDLILQPDGVSRGDATPIDARLVIAAGWHINAHQPNEPFLIPTELSFTLPEGVSVEPPNYPNPESRSFKFAPGKILLVHEGTVRIGTKLLVAPDYGGTEIRISAALRYQACNDTTCSPPSTVRTELVVPVRDGSNVGSGTTSSPRIDKALHLDVARWLGERGLLITVLFVAFLGLGLNLTPCVYPLISVTVAYFGTQGHHHTLRIAILAFLYVLGIAISFATIGIVASLSGGMFGALLQKPAVLVAVAALMIVLALSSFGLYQFQPPGWLMQKASGAAPGFLGAFLMGLTMGVVAAPCIGPVVVGLLVFVGSRQDPILGLELFLALGIGMGLPYLALAMVAGSLKALPRSGDWLIWVERAFGFILVGLAAYFVAPLFPRSVGRLLVPLVVGAAGFYLGFLDRAGRTLRYFRLVQRAAGLSAIAISLWLVQPPAAQTTIRWTPFTTEALELAQAAGQPVLIDFIADWCIPCHEMDGTTFADSDVQIASERFATLRADLTAETPENTALIERYDVKGVPTLLFFDSMGNEAERLVGFVTADDLLSTLQRVS